MCAHRFALLSCFTLQINTVMEHKNYTSTEVGIPEEGSLFLFISVYLCQQERAKKCIFT